MWLRRSDKESGPDKKKSDDFGGPNLVLGLAIGLCMWLPLGFMVWGALGIPIGLAIGVGVGVGLGSAFDAGSRRRRSTGMVNERRRDISVVHPTTEDQVEPRGPNGGG